MPGPWVRSRDELPRLPILPKWVTDRETAVAAAGYAGARVVHVAGFHTARAGRYYLRLALRSPVGLARCIAWLTRWVLDAESKPIRAALGSAVTLDSPHASSLARLNDQTRDTFKRRGTGVGIVALVLLVFGPPLLSGLGGWWHLLIVATLLGVLGWIGRERTRPITDRVVAGQEAPRLTGDLILTALGSLGIAELNKSVRNGPDAVRFVSPVTRDGAGWRADLDLPAGVTAGDIVERRDRLASGLRRAEGCVWPEGDVNSHAGRLVLYVADHPLAKLKPVPWPLLKAGRVNIFEPFPFGTDQRGKPVTICPMFASMVVGAVPRMGKTAALRTLSLGAALHPRVELHIFNLKGGADLAALDAVAHASVAGDSDEELAEVMADLIAVQKQMRARYRTLKAVGRDRAPDAKLTSALADDRSLGLAPVLVVADEVQVLFEHPKFGRQAEEVLADLVRRGPAVGVMVVCATQRPDAKSLPTAISANAILRYCLKVSGQVANDLVLGTSSYRAGVRASMFARSDVGVGWLAGEADDPQIVRAHYLDLQQAEDVAARARAMREKAGLLTGQAAGIEADVEDTDTVLDHLRAVWPDGAKRQTCAELAELLADRYDQYAGWEGAQVTSAVAPYGIKTVQVGRRIDGEQTNRRGLARTALDAASAGRQDGAA